MIRTLCFISIVAFCLSQQLDEGYNTLYETYDQKIDRTCSPLSQKMNFQHGTWIIPSVGEFELGDNKFTSVLDGFGKLHKFEFTAGPDSSTDQVCFTSRMIESGFYNQSHEKNHIAPSVLFMDTTPPLDYNFFKKMMGPNDNVYVKVINTIE